MTVEHAHVAPRTPDELLLLSPLPLFSFALIGSPSCQDVTEMPRLMKPEDKCHTNVRHWGSIPA